MPCQLRPCQSALLVLCSAELQNLVRLCRNLAVITREFQMDPQAGPWFPRNLWIQFTCPWQHPRLNLAGDISMVAPGML